MSRILTASALALSLVAGLPAAASAQSYTAPAGIPAYAAPGGLVGATGTPTLQRRSHESVTGTASGNGVDTTGSIGASRAVRGRTAR